MPYFKNLIFLICLLIFNGCLQEKDFTLEKCKKLAYLTFKGLPKESHQFKKFCSKYKLNNLNTICKVALNDLILGKKKSYLTKKYGEEIMDCFTQNDLDKFLNSN